MLKAVKVRIYPTEEQVIILAKSFGCVRWLWNHSLSLMSQTYQETGKGLSASDMKKQIPVLKQEYEWLKDCYSQCLQQSVLNLSQAFINFFDGLAGYPNFKSKHGKQSIQYPQNVKILSEAQIKFPGFLGIVPARIHRPIDGMLKTVTVSQTFDGRYYASLLVDNGTEKPKTSSEGRAVGIDLGLIDFVVTSDGSKYQNPKHLKKHERNLKRKQRQLSRKQDKTTAKRRRARVALARVHAKIARVREDFLHKLSRKIVNENQVIVVEDLAVKNMVKNHSLAKAISESALREGFPPQATANPEGDVGWGQFCTMLKYKAEFDGKIYLEIGRFFPSTHLCSETLLPIPKMNLDQRSFSCPQCGQQHDRDINAAVNIRNEGLRLLSLGTSDTALGGNVRPKRYGRKSTTVAAVPNELGSLHSPLAGV